MITDIFEDKKAYDCYVREKFGIFVPIIYDSCNLSEQYEYPYYEIIIDFNDNSEKIHNYRAVITSPNISHKRKASKRCYIILIEKEYFESRYRMYNNEIPKYKEYEFDFCSDILKTLNTFIFEYSKSMRNSEVTLDAQTEIVTHWIIRSLFGETLDMRAVASDYSVARAQHYMEQHYMEHITVKKLTEIVCMSETTLNRRFKKETGITPIEYLIDVRIKMAKLMLKRMDIPITEVALNCGFGNTSHFSSCFIKKVKVSPREYRNLWAE